MRTEGGGEERMEEERKEERKCGGKQGNKTGWNKEDSASVSFVG